jgi:hypothetical protein
MGLPHQFKGHAMTDNRPKGLYMRYLEKLAQRRTAPVKDLVGDEQYWRAREKWHAQNVPPAQCPECDGAHGRHRWDCTLDRAA